MVFEAKKSELSNIVTVLSKATDSFSGQVADVQRHGRQALLKNKGDWVRSEEERLVKLQTGLTALHDGLDGLHDSCESASWDLAVLSQKRDDVLSVVGTTASDYDRVYCDTCANCGRCLSAVLDSFGALSKARKIAADGVAGLGNGPEQSVMRQNLNMLSTQISFERLAADSLSDSWDTYRAAIQQFDDEYSAKFAGPLLDKTMMDSASAKTFDSVLKGVNLPKDMKKGIDDDKKILKDLIMSMDLAEMADDNPGLGNRLLKSVKEFAKGRGWQLSKNDAETILDNLLASRQKSAEATFSRRFVEKLKSGSGTTWKQIGEMVHEEASTGAVVGEVKGMAKGLGEIGTALQVFSVGSDAYGAYHLTAGNAGDKWASVVTEVSADVVDIGVNYAASAAIGAAVGGPLGAVVGVVGGMAVGFVWDQFKKTDWYKSGKNTVRNQFDKWFGGKHHD